jgi:RimJ/RimL family protein N-acetyltransferase
MLEVVEMANTVLGDGTMVRIRPIESGDVVALVEFHEGLSFGTVYRRFFGVHPHLGTHEAEHFCAADNVDRFALVAVADDAVVGVARMERVDPATTAEVAFVLADRFQHRGLGRVLALRLAAAASERGITELVADILPDNLPMLRLLPDAGFAVTVSLVGGIVRQACPIPIQSGTAPPRSERVPPSAAAPIRRLQVGGCC